MNLFFWLREELFSYHGAQFPSVWSATGHPGRRKLVLHVRRFMGMCMSIIDVCPSLVQLHHSTSLHLPLHELISLFAFQIAYVCDNLDHLMLVYLSCLACDTSRE